MWKKVSPSTRNTFVCGLPYVNDTTTTPKVTGFTTISTPTVKCHAMCDDGWAHFNGFCYKVLPLLKIWQEAEDLCIYSGAHLVSIHNEEENNFVNDLAAIGVNNTRITWIGTYKQNGEWFYTDNSTVDFFKWGPGFPNGIGDSRACITTFPDAYSTQPAKYWGDDYCGDNWNPVNFVCKKPKY